MTVFFFVNSDQPGLSYLMLSFLRFGISPLGVPKITASHGKLVVFGGVNFHMTDPWDWHRYTYICLMFMVNVCTYTYTVH